MKQITVYSLPECERCNEIKAVFKKHKVKFTDVSDREEFEKVGITSAPALLIGDTFIKDYDEILNWMVENHLMKKSEMNIEEWLGNHNQLGIDIWNKKYRRNYETFDEWVERVSGGDKDVASLIKEKKFLFGGRILSNRGVNDERVTLSNCYVIAPPEDNIESIYETAKKLARTYSYGGGCGIDISKLSPTGAKINNQAKSTSGAVSFMDTFAQVTEQIGQNGRRAALMISIDCTHPDLEKFITIKSDLNKVTSANISVRVSDDFMRAVQNDCDWELYFHRPETDETITKIVKAKEIYHLLCENNWNYAEPGILFWDRIEGYNLLNNNPEFKYAGTNPCAEEP